MTATLTHSCVGIDLGDSLDLVAVLFSSIAEHVELCL